MDLSECWEGVPFPVAGLASPATNRSWRKKHVLATRTWGAVTCSPNPSNLERKGTPFLALLPRHWGARASFCEINVPSLLGAMGHPLFVASRGPLANKAAGKLRGRSWNASSREESWLVPGAQRTVTGQGQAAHANGQVLGKRGPCPGGGGKQRRASCPEPALAGT